MPDPEAIYNWRRLDDRKECTTPARWIPAFWAMSAMQNGLTQYLHNGNLPSNALYGRGGSWLTGRKTGGKNDEAELWPSYAKETVNFTVMALKSGLFDDKGLKVPDLFGMWQALNGLRVW
jgi:hypothetical protein